jgi:multiple sugar transport system substrate-binding protein
VGAAMNETAAKAATGDAKVSDIFDTAQKTSVEALKNAKLPVKE